MVAEDVKYAEIARYREGEFLAKRNSVNVKSNRRAGEIAHSSGRTDFPGTLDNSRRNDTLVCISFFYLFTNLTFESHNRKDDEEYVPDCSNT